MKRRLGVNIDHIATLRQARQVRYPDPVQSLTILKKSRVDQVTLHLREDRRHIRDDDLRCVIEARMLRVNLEMAVTDEMVGIARRFKPHTCTLVPEKRQEVTTEGGLDCVKQVKSVGRTIEDLQKVQIHMSAFIDPDARQIAMANRLGAEAVELHTGSYCEEVEKFYLRNETYAFAGVKSGNAAVLRELQKLRDAAALAKSLGLKVYAGHGLHVGNLKPVTRISEIEEYNIGHAIIARAVFVGLAEAIREIQALLKGGTG